MHLRGGGGGALAKLICNTVADMHHRWFFGLKFDEAMSKEIFSPFTPTHNIVFSYGVLEKS